MKVGTVLLTCSSYIQKCCMTIISHDIKGVKFVEIITSNMLIETAENGADLMADFCFQGFDGIILHEKNISPAFFDLKNGMAGEILQKFSNYHMKLAIVGEFISCTDKSIQDFMYESNKRGQINFVGSSEAAIEKLGI